MPFCFDKKKFLGATIRECRNELDLSERRGGFWLKRGISVKFKFGESTHQVFDVIFELFILRTKSHNVIRGSFPPRIELVGFDLLDSFGLK